MKKLSILFFLGCTHAISAQVTITAGAQLYMQGNAQLTLQNTNLVNNGSFTAGTGTVSFTGNILSAISGTQPLQFYQLEINKTAGNSVSLQRAINVLQQINFTAGYLDLNGNDIDLGTSGMLNGEQETSRIIGPNGGQVLFSTVLNAPSSINPANMGAIITSSQNLGNVIIKRGHQSQVNGSGMGSSILRYYDILPANNNTLNAVLRFQYFDGELNGLPENSLVFWSSPNNTNWTNQGFTSNNTTTNYAEKTGISSFSRWTLSAFNDALPVRFTAFNVKCNGNNILINWKTAQEQNSSHYDIERSTDGINWKVIGNQPAAGNSNSERSYLFADNNPVQSSYYRIAQYDADGRAQYTSILKSSCNIATDVLNLWPNPASDAVFINITVAGGSQAVIKVFDNKGALIKIQKKDLLPGSNQLSVNIKNLANGIYQFAIEWNNGQARKTMRVIKY